MLLLSTLPPPRSTHDDAADRNWRKILSERARLTAAAALEAALFQPARKRREEAIARTLRRT
jgi:hypothetical protein